MVGNMDARAPTPSRRSSGPAPARHAVEPLWVAFLNTAPGSGADAGSDVLRNFDRFVAWLVAANALDAERAPSICRRAEQQPAGAAAVLVDARRVRAALRALPEAGAPTRRARAEIDALTEINRVLGRSAGMRRIERGAAGGYTRSFVTVGDAFAGLLVPVADSAAEMLVDGGVSRVRTCADVRCGRAFVDSTRNGRRRWCDMGTCGNRAKAARHRQRHATGEPAASARGVPAQAGEGASLR